MKPYTYLIKHRPTNMFYYGVRYSKNCDPSDLWEKYFTSSKHVKNLIEQYGKESFDYEVRKTFDTAEQARSWETRVLSRIRAVSRTDFLNKTVSGELPVLSGDQHPLYGVGHSEETKMKMRKPHKKLSEETKGKMSEAKSGDKNPMYGTTGGMFGKKMSREAVEQRKKTMIDNDIPFITEETKNKISNTCSKLLYWNDGTSTIRRETCPGEGWIRGTLKDLNGQKNPMFGKKGAACPHTGKLWWNDGTKSIKSKDCPGEGWIRGRYSKKS